MGNGDTQLGCSGSGRRAGIDIAHHEYQVGAFGEQHRFDGLHHLGGLLGVTTDHHLEVVIGLRHAEVLYEDFAYLFVVRPAGTQQDLIKEGIVRFSRPGLRRPIVHRSYDRATFVKLGRVRRAAT